MAPKDVRKFDPFVPFGVASATQAIKDSGFEVTEANCARIGVAMGAGIGGLSTIEENTAKWLEAKTAAQDFPVLHPRQHHQCGRRAGVDPSRPARTEHRAGHGLHDVDAFDRPGLPPDPVRRRRHHGGGRFRDGVHAARRRQLLPGACAVPAQRRACAREPSVGQGPRRFRDGRRRRRRRPRGIRAREGTRRADLCGARRLRHERRRAPHHRAAGRRRGRAARDDRGHPRRGDQPRRRSTTSTRTPPRPNSATAPRRSRSSARSATMRARSR